METVLARSASTRPDSIGRVAGVNGSQATVELTARAAIGENPTVGKFLALTTGKSIIIGLITEVAEQAFVATASAQTFRKIARLDLNGEIRSETGAARFQRGVIHLGRQRPDQTLNPGKAQVIIHGALGQANGVADCSSCKSGLVFQAQDFAYLGHGKPFCWHRCS